MLKLANVEYPVQISEPLLFVPDPAPTSITEKVLIFRLAMGVLFMLDRWRMKLRQLLWRQLREYENPKDKKERRKKEERSTKTRSRESVYARFVLLVRVYLCQAA